MNLGEYSAGQRDRYTHFAKIVAEILKAAIRENGQLRLQQIQHRAKEPASLKGKLEKAGVLDSEAIEDEVKDLAGCRLIFYTNSDVSAFLSSEILRGNFKVDWIRTKFHHPVPMASDNLRLFISNNFVVELNDARAALPEYEKFQGIRCEVQVQTILNHAWSEMEHDIIYKKPPLEGFGGKLMSSIEERMQKIMRDYLLPAGYEFQKVANDFERLSSGKVLFDERPLKAILACEDNNELHDRLSRFEEHVLPLYDDLRAVHDDVREAILAAMKVGQKRKAKAIETPFGQLKEHTADHVMGLTADILDHLRYVSEDSVLKTFDAICTLFEGATSDDQRKRLLESAKRLAGNSLDVWSKAGPVVQSLLVEQVRGLDVSNLGATTPVILEVLGEVLRPEVRGTSSTYNAITIKTGSVVPSAMLVEVRSHAIELLQRIFLVASSDREKREIIQKLAEASRTPHTGGYPNALVAIALNDSANIVRFLTDVSADQSHILLEEVEHDCLWLYRRNHRLPPAMANDLEVAAARDRLIEAVNAYRDRVNADQRFVIFKTLVGFQSVFPPAWEDDNFDIHGIDTYRKGEIARLVSQVSDETSEDWFEIITCCANTPTDDLATFPSFADFLEQLGRAQPAIVLCYLDRFDSALASFLPPMLCGLEEGNLSEAAIEKVRLWVRKQKHLRQVIQYCERASKLDFNVLEGALKAAINTNDEVSVLFAIRASVARFGDASDKMIDRVFLPALRYLTARGNPHWVNAVWPRSGADGLFQSLTSVHEDEVLASLVHCPDINYRVEDLLKAIGESSPEKVVDFFGMRLRFEDTDHPQRGYDAVPYDLSHLDLVLQKIPGQVVSKVRKWFDTDKEFFSYRGGRLIKLVFPEPDAQVLNPLYDLVAAGTATDLEFVIEVLHNYNGHIGTHEIYREVIESLPTDSPILGDISVALDSTGVVAGEFGFVATYLQKKAEVEPWLKDLREKVRTFAGNHILSLDRQIANEQRRAEQGLELRKRNYGTD